MQKHQQQFSFWYFILTFILLLLIQNYFFTSRVEVLSYGSFKTLLKAGKVRDISIGQQSISGTLINDNLEGLLPEQQLQKFRQSTTAEYRFTTTPVADPGLVAELEEAGVDFGGRFESNWLPTLLSWILPAVV